MISDEIYKFFADMIYTKTGILYTENDYYRLDSRLKELVRVFEKESPQEVMDLFKGPVTPDMDAVLINISTNNETYFFRDVKPFKALTDTVFPAVQASNSTGIVKMWSCASSTGQEIYSILMSILQKNGAEALNKTFIDASDIDTNALAKAKGGIYNGLDVQRGLPITTLMTNFEQREDNHWEINQDIKKRANFFHFNLLTGNYPTNTYDIIFCRNVLIYQDKENKQKILENVWKALKPGGYLFFGSGESLIGMDIEFDRHTIEGLTIYSKPKPE